MLIQNQQQPNTNNHGPIPKDLLFSNQLLMYLAWNNYNYSDATAVPAYVFAQLYKRLTLDNILDNIGR